ncbi:MAG TPA: heme exporter protein CcmB [Terriglobales bacterium]|nr:heme exporter protein CcmB [Terriglobales bacterium]
MLALIRKDLLIELRTRETSAALLLLGLLTLLILSFAFDPTSELRQEAAPGALWVAVAFSAVSALSRCFLNECDNGCMAGLLLSPLDRGSIYLAKTIANIVLMMASLAVLVPVFVLFFDPPLSGGWLWILAALALGVVGVAAVGTLFAAIAVNTRAREIMLPLLMLPLIVPIFLAGIRVTSKLLLGQDVSAVAPWLNLMVGFDVIFLVVGWLAFEYVVSE